MSDAELIKAFTAQARHSTASHRVDRAGWTDDEWIQDAERLMDDLHGSVISLVNGHVLALIARVNELNSRLSDVQRGTLLEARNDLATYRDTQDLRNPGIEFAVEWLDDRAREI